IYKLIASKIAYFFYRIFNPGIICYQDIFFQLTNSFCRNDFFIYYTTFMSNKNGENASFYSNGTSGHSSNGAKDSTDLNLNFNLNSSPKNAKHKNLDLSKYDLICFSHLRWDFVFQRPQHLLSRCAKSQRVFYIEEPIFGDFEQDHFQSKSTKESVNVITPFLKHGCGEEEMNAKLKS